MVRENCPILENKKIAPDHFRMTLGSAAIAAKARPGQFVQVTLSEQYDPFLPRPFSLYSAGKKDFSILYRVVGKGTELLAGKKAGEKLKVLGPLGNGFAEPIFMDNVPARKAKRTGAYDAEGPWAVLVGGGVGTPPLYCLAERLLKDRLFVKKNICVVLGARTAAHLICEKEFKTLGVDLKIATDDGSRGHKGLVTQVLEEVLVPRELKLVQVYACGPSGMLEACAKLCAKYHVECQVSMEELMACGFGACLGCAVKAKADGKHEAGDMTGDFRYALACKEGPVFDSKDLFWE